MRTLIGLSVLLLATGLLRAEPIHDAARAGDVETVKKLIAETPYLRKALDTSGNTPAVIAAGAGQIKVVEYLLSIGVGVNDPTSSRRTMLHAACDGGRLEMVKLLINKYRADITAADDKKWQPIHLAARKNPVDMLQLLIDQKANVNAAANLGSTPLIMATAMKLQPHVQLLLQRRADVNKADDWNRTALHVAAKNKDLPMVELLIKAGAKGGPKDKDGKTALDEAIAAGDPAVIALVEKVSPSAGPDRKSKTKRTK